MTDIPDRVALRLGNPRMGSRAGEALAGQPVAEYVLEPDIDPTLSPRPYLHPVRTLGGVVVTDVLPEDHRWHLGASLAVQDVSGTNLWGGRTYVRGTGYTWREDHGRIVHEGFLTRADDRLRHLGALSGAGAIPRGGSGGDGLGVGGRWAGEALVQRLRWCDPAGSTLLTERRQLAALPVPEHSSAWALDISYTLTAPERDITLGSPATNGRPGGAGYGGFFWRAAPASEPPRVFTARAGGEEAVNGATDDWVALVSVGQPAYSLVFAGLAEGDHWFVRATMYPGVCAAFAFTEPRVIAAGESRTGRHQVLVADGTVTAEQADRLVAAVRC